MTEPSSGGTTRGFDEAGRKMDEWLLCDRIVREDDREVLSLSKRRLE